MAFHYLTAICMPGTESMFIFQQTFSPTAAPIKANVPEFETSLNRREVNTLLVQNNINPSELTRLDLTSAIVNLMRNDAKFATDWQNLTGFDLKSMESILNEYRRLEELSSKLLDDANKRIVGSTLKTARLADKSVKTVQGEQSEADKKAAILLKQFGKIRKAG